jgi:site-specific recombinase XerD
MADHHVALAALRPPHIESFLLRPFEKPATPRTQTRNRKRLLVYLDWLYDKGRLGFAPRCLRVWPKRRLPPLAEQFVTSLVSLKASTCETYRVTMSTFHDWLEKNDLPLVQLQRRELIQWSQQMNDHGLSPVTRKNRMIQVRCYLRWLRESGALSADPEQLVRFEDIPRCPDYLPRPLPLEADRQLQQRLAQADCRYQQGLLLMRYTGLRIGELVSLERNCVHTDHKGNRFLKVPLGKLDNERFVPLDDTTLQLITKIRRRGCRRGRWLLMSLTGKKTRYNQYHRALRKACSDLDLPDRMTTHRLRHTYATALLNGGMSLVGVMRLLGHRNIQMTLRYAAITQETVVKEYYEALAQIAKKYALTQKTTATDAFDPMKALSDIARWLKKNRGQNPADKKVTQALIKRAKRLQTAIQDWISKDG